MNRWQKRVFQAKAFTAFHLADLALRAFPFQKVLRFATARTGTGRPAPAPEREGELVQAAREAIAFIRRYDLRERPDCLPKSLMVFALLGRRGVPVELLMGVRKEPFAAHAWIQLRGEVISDLTMEHRAYTPLMRLSPAAASR